MISFAKKLFIRVEVKIETITNIFITIKIRPLYYSCTRHDISIVDNFTTKFLRFGSIRCFSFEKKAQSWKQDKIPKIEIVKKRIK